MNKRFTKIICAIVASVFVFGVIAIAGCGQFYGSDALTGNYSDGEVKSNGGFAVEKGSYVYYINGLGSSTADNEYGTPVKGAVYRISKENLKKRNYSTVDKVVGNIAYSSNYNGGIFIYGDRIYYGTPSTAKNSEGVVQNSYLDMKSTKLDGTETMKNFYVQFPNASYEYRYVEENGTVYLLYAATSETLYEETTGVTNLHSYNTKTGEDTLLAYNVDSVTFDSEDKTNPRVYYTMSVRDYATDTDYGYNQVYTVTASATEDKFAGKLNKDTVKGWNDDEEEGDVDRYINCGDLVLDGIGHKDYIGNELSKTLFNYNPEDVEVNETVNQLSYTYTIRQYVNGNVFYTRTTDTNDSAYLFSLKQEDEIKPIKNNLPNSSAILNDGSNAGSYKFLFDNEKNLTGVLYAESSAITVNKVDNGKLNASKEYSKISDKYYPIADASSATIIGVEGNYLYYTVSNEIFRIDYTGSNVDYNRLQTQEVKDSDFNPVQILDLSTASGWYNPEIIDGYLLFASSTANMVNFNYIMVFDLHKTETALMSNKEIRGINEQYEGITKIIGEDGYGDTEKYPTDKYANLTGALWYAFYDGDDEYLREYAKELNDNREEDTDEIYSELTFAEYEKFLTPTAENEWKDYTATKEVNGKTVYANRRDYYYSVVGVMSDEDKEAYEETIKTNNLAPKPEEEPEVGWYEGLSTVEKTFFIIGMCVLGILVVGGGVALTLFLVRRKKEEPTERRRRIKVDTTDDKDIDVYDYDKEDL